MKDFYELLADNGIYVPAEPDKPNALKTWLFERRLKRFNKKWIPIKNVYEALEGQYIDKQKHWKLCYEELLTNWNIELPSIEVASFDFRTPSEAELSINAEYKRIRELNPHAAKTEIEQNARAEWVSELIASAPANCKIIVIRSKSYKPHKENMKQFAEYVANGEEAYIYMVLSPVWVAFYPTSKVDTRLWAITKNNSIVQYID